MTGVVKPGHSVDARKIVTHTREESSSRLFLGVIRSGVQRG